MEVINYVELRHHLKFGHRVFAYLDKAPYRADRIFLDHNLKVNFINEFVSLESDYSVVMVSVKKKNGELFETCMTELKKKMLILGHRDYDMECQKLRKLLGLDGGDENGKRST